MGLKLYGALVAVAGDSLSAVPSASVNAAQRRLRGIATMDSAPEARRLAEQLVGAFNTVGDTRRHSE